MPRRDDSVDPSLAGMQKRLAACRVMLISRFASRLRDSSSQARERGFSEPSAFRELLDVPGCQARALRPRASNGAGAAHTERRASTC